MRDGGNEREEEHEQENEKEEEHEQEHENEKEEEKGYEVCCAGIRPPFLSMLVSRGGFR